jgi:hypothetical protein
MTGSKSMSYPIRKVNGSSLILFFLPGKFPFINDSSIITLFFRLYPDPEKPVSTLFYPLFFKPVDGRSCRIPARGLIFV